MHLDAIAQQSLLIIGGHLNFFIDLCNYIVSNLATLNFSPLFNTISTLHLWDLTIGYNESIKVVSFSFAYAQTFWKTLFTALAFKPTFETLEYTTYFFAMQNLYGYILADSTSVVPTLSTSLTLKLHTNMFFDVVVSKWSYVLILFGIGYLISSNIPTKVNHGFIMYLSIFKNVSDLAEQEYGAYEDYQFFVLFLVQLFVWYCWVLFAGILIWGTGVNYLFFVITSVIITILTIPVRLLWDFGVSFSMYVRGSASSSNLIVEAFFDIIGVIIIFTRFIVQNIRFVLVFVAYFELFEWTTTTMNYSYLMTFYSFDELMISISHSNSIWEIAIYTFKTILVYLYHLLHLVIVSFMQIGVFLMVSFWLFFFLYTSFFKITLDTYFIKKRQ